MNDILSYWLYCPQFCVDPRLYHYRWSWVCQAFSDYQMQQMTSNFIEQFGFNDEEFADQDDVVEWVLIPVWLDLLVICNSCGISSFNVLVDRKSSVNLSFCIKTHVAKKQSPWCQGTIYMRIYSQYCVIYKSTKYGMIRWWV